MNPLVLDGPEAITLSGQELSAGASVERDARLLVAGDYPGKNLHVTEADLDALVTNFRGPVPVKVEHIDSPLDPLGQVVRVWRQGRALMGRVSFPAAMAAFLSERGAAKLSCGLLKEPAWTLLEASLTLTPHVPTATLLSDTERAELVRLRQETAHLRAGRLDAQIGQLKAAGKLVPAAEPFARALLSAGGGTVVTLSDPQSSGGDAQSVGEVFLRFLAAQPPVVNFAEMAKAQVGTKLSGGGAGVAGADPDGDGEPELSAEHREVCKRMGLDPQEVARTMHTDRRKAAQKGGM